MTTHHYPGCQCARTPPSEGAIRPGETWLGRERRLALRMIADIEREIRNGNMRNAAMLPQVRAHLVNIDAGRRDRAAACAGGTPMTLALREVQRSEWIPGGTCEAAALWFAAPTSRRPAPARTVAWVAIPQATTRSTRAQFRVSDFAGAVHALVRDVRFANYDAQVARANAAEAVLAELASRPPHTPYEMHQHAVGCELRRLLDARDAEVARLRTEVLRLQRDADAETLSHLLECARADATVARRDRDRTIGLANEFARAARRYFNDSTEAGRATLELRNVRIMLADRRARLKRALAERDAAIAARAVDDDAMTYGLAECERLRAERDKLITIVRACAKADTCPSAENDAALQLAEDWVAAHPEKQ